MDLKAARSSIFGAYLEDTARKLAEARQREVFILVKSRLPAGGINFKHTLKREARFSRKKATE